MSTSIKLIISSVGNLWFDDFMISNLAHLTNLTTLDITNTNLTNQVFQYLDPLINLTLFRVFICYSISIFATDNTHNHLLNHIKNCIQEL